MFAEERYALSALQEVHVLMDASEGGAEHTSLNPQAAVDLAKAAHDSLLAEETLAHLKVAECEAKLQLLRDDAEAASARSLEANFQVGKILAILDAAHIRVNLPLETGPYSDELSSPDLDLDPFIHQSINVDYSDDESIDDSTSMEFDGEELGDGGSSEE